MEKNKKIAVVFDDHLLFLDAFSALIERLEIFSSVQTFDDERLLSQFLINHHKAPIYLFLDYYLRDKNALLLINETRRLNRQVKVIVTSSVTNPTIIANILTYNPQGLISKSSGFDTILQCIDTIDGGGQYTCPTMSEIVVNIGQISKIPFSNRELEILQYFAQGLSIAQTADQSHLSKHTIVAHRRNMMAKVHVNSITELLAFARNKELI
ncbi:response regulator transcription factor [Algoriphagus sp. NG3]|uniref:response regulator transcription factor n=1 Tax=Algoriphagus sp. NG3 TaxID=3097546 RepID=UPI002A8164DB|nr:response regulator transcription factor [Algoriphagus sp. NG3]WPR77754.1 response regulator transcription factor [Algoriphagus sp. NG3]